jgi:hypothetical protein
MFMPQKTHVQMTGAAANASPTRQEQVITAHTIIIMAAGRGISQGVQKRRLKQGPRKVHIT